MDPADAGEQHRGGQAGDPAAGRLGPLGGPADVGQLVEGGHEVAVDVAGPPRVELARQHGQHGLVQQGHPLGHPALPDQRPALAQVAAATRLGSRVAPADVPDPPARRRPRRRGRGPPRAALHSTGTGGSRARRSPARRRAAAGRGPPARADHLVAAQEQVQGDPDGRHRRPRAGRSSQVAPVGPLERRRRLLDLAQPPGGVAQGVQVIGRELTNRMSRLEAVTSRRPVLTTVRVAGCFQDIGHVFHRPIQYTRPPCHSTSSISRSQ